MNTGKDQRWKHFAYHLANATENTLKYDSKKQKSLDPGYHSLSRVYSWTRYPTSAAYSPILSGTILIRIRLLFWESAPYARTRRELVFVGGVKSRFGAEYRGERER
jgi:hypothetical protein